MTKENFLLGVSFLIFLLIGTYYLWNNVNIYINKEYLLKHRIEEYQTLLKMNHCVEVFNGFLSNHSTFKRENYVDEQYHTNADFFISICSDNSAKAVNGVGHIKRFELGKIDSILFNNWKNADVYIKGAKNEIQTWVFEDGFWKRDL